ncbi:MAG: pyruvate kinase [Candidatus Nanopelagicales bacterium]|nr:pyruvate kinase [Candidatus Nanopelagicales bacterium]
MRRAKIVCTLGPATATSEIINKLVDAGMNVARLNLSHGDQEVHTRSYELVRAASISSGKGVGILADLQGPKIRLARFASGPVELRIGDSFTITTKDVPGDATICGTTYSGLPGDCKVGDRILIDDGRVGLEVVQVTTDSVITQVTEAGTVSDNKGINLPGVAVSVPALSEKDIADLRWALRQGVDMIALSFVRSAADVVDVHKIMDEEGRRIPVIAKIEKPQAVENLKEIIDAFDGIMVARGDLGVELPLEQVPMVQKRAIELARAATKPVIVATQMLESMITSNRPTRAEASDVANAVLDGSDALMLSGETSIGVDPLHVVETMSKIITHIEAEALEKLPKLADDAQGETAKAMCLAAVDVATHVEAVSLVAFTETGSSARLVARHRSRTRIMAFTPNEHVRNQLSLVWGTETFLVPRVSHTDEMVAQLDKILLDFGIFKMHDPIVVIAGVPPGIPGSTNGMRVHKLGHGADNA